jgi:hypothetical protein
MSGSNSGSGYDNWDDIPTEPAAAAADSEPEWDSEDFVPPPVGTATPAPAPAAASTPTPAPATAAPVEPSAPEQLELMYSTVLSEHDMQQLDIFGNRAAFTPRDIQQYIADFYNPPEQEVRGGGRNRKHRTEPNAMPTRAERAESSVLYEGCKDFIERQPMYNRLPTNSQQKKLFKAFYSYCDADYHVSQVDAAGERRWTNMNAQIAQLWLDFIRIRGSSRGSVLRV